MAGKGIQLSIGRTVLGGLLALGLFSCSTAYRKSVGGDPARLFSRIYFTDFNMAWQSTLDALKATRPDVQNREGGYIQTRWAENTAEKNFIDSYGPAQSYLKAQYRFKVTLAKGLYNGKPSVKVTVLKEQMVQRDVLEGWRPVESDEVEENTLLYRIGRVIQLKTRIAQLVDAKVHQAAQEGVE